MTLLNSIGWAATAVFACSYFAKESSRLRIIQAVAAIMWVVYGVLIHAMPVVVANTIVAGAAGYSSLSRRSESSKDGDAIPQPVSPTAPSNTP